MKRGLLIAGGALGGLGAVMAITPPQFSSTESLAIGGGAMGGSTPSAGVASLLAVAFLLGVPVALVAAGVGESTAVATAVGVDVAIAPPPIAKDSLDEN